MTLSMRKRSDANGVGEVRVTELGRDGRVVADDGGVVADVEMEEWSLMVEEVEMEEWSLMV